MKSNKSPGSDGIPAEFYQTFWPDLQTVLIESLNSAYETGELSPTQKRSILSLIAWRDSVKQLKRNEDFSSICGAFPSICGVSL